MHNHYLQPLFDPKSIALIGASSRTQAFGGRVLEALTGGGYTGKLYMVNPGYRTVGEHKCYPTAQALPEVVDLAVIVSPVHTVERVIEDCAARGIKHAMVMTGGFASNRNWGTTPTELADKARQLGVRLLGPSCLGLVNTWANLILTPAAQPIHKGNVGLISHSASMCSSVVDWAHSNNVGFSTILTPGKESDLSISEVLDYLLHDYHTHAILIYLDRIPSAREFLNALSTAARVKPVVVMKSPEAGRQYCDALSRTGEVLNYDHINDSALARAGAVRVNSFGELFSAAQILSSKTKLRGKRLAVVSNGKGPASLIADRLATTAYPLEQFSPETVIKLDNLLGTEWSRRNPVVLRGRNMTPGVQAEVVKLIANSKDVDAIMVAHAPDGWVDSTAVAQAVIEAERPTSVPLLSCFMGENLTRDARELMRENKIPTFRTPESAANGYSYLCRHLQNQLMLLQVPDASGWREQTAVDESRALVKSVLDDGRRVMRLPEAQRLLENFNLPANPARQALSAEEAVKQANAIGYPISLALCNSCVNYRTEVDGVHLNINNDDEVRAHYGHLLVNFSKVYDGSSMPVVIVSPMLYRNSGRRFAVEILNTPQYGPMISLHPVGAPGSVAGAHAQAVQLPPLNTFLADRLLESPTIAPLLNRYRSFPGVNKQALRDFLLGISNIASEISDLHSLTIDPLLVDADGVIAENTHIVLQKRVKGPADYGHMAIHPYPSKWVSETALKDGTPIVVRPIRPEDGEQLHLFARDRMSDQSRYYRFMQVLKQLPPNLLAKFTKIDYVREMAFVLMRPTEDGDEMIGVSRYSLNPDKTSCEFAVSIGDDWTGHGLAKVLMHRLIEHAKAHGLELMEGIVLRNNHAMEHLMHSLGFTSKRDPEDLELLIYSLDLLSYDEPQRQSA